MNKFRLNKIIFFILLVLILSLTLTGCSALVRKSVKKQQMRTDIIEKPFDSFYHKYMEIDSFCKSENPSYVCEDQITAEIFSKYDVKTKITFCNDLHPFIHEFDIGECYSNALSGGIVESYDELFESCGGEENWVCPLMLNNKFLTLDGNNKMNLINDIIKWCKERGDSNFACVKRYVGDFKDTVEFKSKYEELLDICLTHYPRNTFICKTKWLGDITPNQVNT